MNMDGEDMPIHGLSLCLEGRLVVSDDLAGYAVVKAKEKIMCAMEVQSLMRLQLCFHL